MHPRKNVVFERLETVTHEVPASEPSPTSHYSCPADLSPAKPPGAAGVFGVLLGFWGCFLVPVQWFLVDCWCFFGAFLRCLVWFS